jgi:hypothetical protein
MKKMVAVLVMAAIMFFSTQARVSALQIGLEAVDNVQLSAALTAGYSHWQDTYTAGYLSLTLANTSEIPSGISGFMFHLPPEVEWVMSWTVPTGWELDTGGGVEEPLYLRLASPAGQNLIMSGAARMFMIGVQGDAVDELTAESFVSLIKSDLGGIGRETAFLAEMKTSDGALHLAMPPANVAPVPEPATGLLLATGLGGLLFFFKRRRSVS